MSADEYLNPQLFDPGPEHTGPLSVRQFFQEAQWHATHEYPTWADDVRKAGVPVHSGTAQAAADTPATFGARYPVRPTNVSLDRFSDASANAGDAAFRKSRGVAGSESVDTSSEEASAAETEDVQRTLDRGGSVAYTNVLEDKGSTSYISPPGSFETLRDTTNFHEVPNAREYLLPGEAQAQGLPVSNRFEDAIKDTPAKQPRLLEAVQGARRGGEQWVRGEDVQSIPDEDLRRIGSRTKVGNLHPTTVNSGRLKELFAGMETL